MTDKEPIERTGPGRRRFPSDDRALKCLWCEDKDESSKLRWTEHLQDEHERRETCSKMITELKASISSLVPWKFFYVVFGLALGAIGWLYIDHFGLTKTVTRQTVMLEITAENVTQMSMAMGLKPKQMPEVKSE